MAFDAREYSGEQAVLIIGTGFSGLGMGIRLKQAGIDSFTILERADGVGGTWRDNHYPGCACDVQSHLYSFSFEQNPEWTRMFAPQPEIRSYLEHCADKYGLKAHIRFNAEVVEARYDEAAALWRVRTRDGRAFSARALVSGMGGLSNPAFPKIPGLETFIGPTFHSAQWNHEVDLRGKRVAVIGSGASAIQFVPQIVPQVAHLDYYQRTPPWILPKPDRDVSAFERRLFRLLPFTQRLFRNAIYWLMESRVVGFKRNSRIMPFAQRVARAHIRRQVADPALRRKVTPDYAIGCKRILISNDYYPAISKSHVDVITDAIAEVRPHGIVTADGSEREVDAIIFGTGFKAQDPIPRGAVFGRGGIDIVDSWKDGPEAYLGTMTSGFPNFFMLMGPNTGLGHNSMVYMIESQIEFVMNALRTLRDRHAKAIDVRPEVQKSYNAGIQQRLAGAVWSSGCKSWYLNDRGKNTTLWPGFTFVFRRLTRRFEPKDYVLEPERSEVRS